MMKIKNSHRNAFVMHIALVSVLTFAGFILTTKIIAQDNKNPTQQTNSIKVLLWTPEDDPSFSHDRYSSSMGFSSWVASQIKYPPNALKEKIQGWVHVGYIVELDGTISNVKINAAPNPELGEAVANVVRSCLTWMPAKNKENAAPFKSSINIKFDIPERVLSSQDLPVFVTAEVPSYLFEELHRFLDEGQMPEFPQAKNASLEATDEAVREWIDQNLKYPDKALKEKVEGTITIRFIVNKKGELEDFTVIKSIHPSLDAEALRVLSLMPDWKPAKQGGEPKDVYYYAEVKFKLPN